MNRSNFFSGTGLLLVAVTVTVTGISCGSYECRTDSDDSLLRRVPVAPDYVPPGPVDEGLNAKGRVRKQTYSIDSDGTFTFYRSVETEVGFLGAELSDLNAKAAEKAGVEPFGGAMIRSVDSRGPAGRAGLKRNDIILGFEGKSGLSADRLDYLIAQSKPGQRVPITIQRGHDSLDLEVEMGADKRIESGKLLQDKLELVNDMDRTGLRLVELTDEVRPIVLGSRSTRRGLMVIDVLPGGPAFFAGVRVRDVITGAGDQPLAGVSDYKRVVGSLEKGQEVSFRLLRSDGSEPEAEVSIAAAATREGGFDVPVLVSYKSRPAHRHFDLLLGFLFNHETCYAVRERDGQGENFRSRNWGMIVDLVKYTNNSRGKGKLVFLWLIPIWWGGD